MYFYQEFYIFLLAWFGTGNRNCFVGMFLGMPCAHPCCAPWCILGSDHFRRACPLAELVSTGRGCPGSPGAPPQHDMNQGGTGGPLPGAGAVGPWGCPGMNPGLAACVAPPGAQPGGLALSGTVRRRQASTCSGSPEHVPVTPGGERRP